MRLCVVVQDHAVCASVRRKADAMCALLLLLFLFGLIIKHLSEPCTLAAYNTLD